MKTTIAVDAMGGDFGPSVTVPACLSAVKKHPELKIKLVGDLQQIEPFFKKIPKRYQSEFDLVPAIIDDDEQRMSTFSSVRNKSDSPIGVCVGLLKDKQADGMLSAGHTSYLLANSTFRLKRIPSVNRPAICTIIPSPKGFSLLLDVGANLESSAENLHQYALMGNVLYKTISDTRHPRIALLNVGAEDVKGTSVVKEAAKYIDENPYLIYHGFVEGLDLYSGEAEVIVCDGLSGNMALKASEAAVGFINNRVKTSLTNNLLRRMLLPLTALVLADLKRQLNPQSYNGAVLLGVQGVVVKSHGHANRYGFSCALERAFYAAQGNLVEQISERLNAMII